jgi:hypothetical protein
MGVLRAGPDRARRRVVAAVLAIALVVALGACKRAGVALGGACQQDGDCASGLLCHETQCLQQGNVEQMRKAANGATADAPARKIGDRLEVEWKGAYKPATIIGVVAPGSYRVHYEGHDASWDEVIGEARIKGGGRKRRDATVAAPAATGSTGL